MLMELLDCNLDKFKALLSELNVNSYIIYTYIFYKDLFGQEAVLCQQSLLCQNCQIVKTISCVQKQNIL